MDVYWWYQKKVIHQFSTKITNCFCEYHDKRRRERKRERKKKNEIKIKINIWFILQDIEGTGEPVTVTKLPTTFKGNFLRRMIAC
jgi:hypothetical protein